MIAAVRTKRSADPCIVFWTGKAGLLSIVTRTYCGEEVPAGEGVMQLPDKASFCGDCKLAVSKSELALEG